MNHQPATSLPSDDEPWWATVEEFNDRLTALLRDRDWDAAERLAREYLERAESAYEAAIYARSRANALAALGRQAESLEADELAERLVPIEPYFKIDLARRLIAEFGRPEDGLAKLAEAEPLLEPNMRARWLSEQALAFLALGRDADAVACFRDIARPEWLSQMRKWDYIGLVDFRVVSGLITRRLVPELCVAYLEAAEEIAAQHNPDRLGNVQKLLAEARAAGA
jgi:tetratricopeptide (TPR) repeat protein